MRLRFAYTMTILFDAPVTRHSFSLKALPCDTLRQKVAESGVSVEPRVPIMYTRDAGGNIVFGGNANDEHSRFSVTTEGIVETLGDGISFVPETDAVEGDAMMYRQPTRKTAPGITVRRLAGETLSYDEGIARAEAAMHLVHESLQYEKGVTGPGTTAEDALALGKGVCQDYAHALVSVLRTAGIPARYVVGYTIGEGESHAWTEALVDGRWYGLDPTADKPVGGRHIKVSHGRDFDDCRINRGVYYGALTSEQNVAVTVTEDVVP